MWMLFRTVHFSTYVVNLTIILLIFGTFQSLICFLVFHDFHLSTTVYLVFSIWYIQALYSKNVH